MTRRKIKVMESAPEPGQCLMHGYVIERCCALWEPRKRTTYLRDAVRDALKNVKPPR